MSQPTEPLEAAIEAYFAGIADADQLRTVEAWIHADPANAKAFMVELHLRELVGQHLRERANDTGLILAELARLEAQATPEIVTLDALPGAGPAASATSTPARATHDKPDPLTPHEIASVTTYLLAQALKSKPARYAYAAAILLLATTLLIPWANQTPAPQTAQTSTQPANPSPAVATLTATHNAAWAGPASVAPAKDNTLHPGDRLTLTAGFAEITTNRGAIAILEAPATIQLLHNDNAIELVSGKLVGICETESSKGFVVRTPHMDVTDLGTRFGVDASQPAATEVHVFEGMVQANHLVNAQTRRIGSGQSVSSTTTGAGFVPIRYSTAQFAAVALDGSLNRAVLNGDVPEFLGVVDLIAGGDGTSGRSQVGLDPVTGRFVNAQTPGLWQERTGDGRFQPVNDSAFIAGTFIPKNNGSVDGLPDGLTLPSIPQNSAMVYGAIWCGGDYPETTKSAYSAVINGIDYTAGDRRALYLHTGCGVTLDLKAIRSAYPNHRVTRFVATANNTTQPDEVGKMRRSQIIVGLDDLAVVDHPFVVVPTAASQPLEIDIELQDARYLTLISTDGGDGIVLDRIVFGNPRLILEPINP